MKNRLGPSVLSQLFLLYSACQTRSLARRVLQAMALVLVKRRNAARGLVWRALREPSESTVTALRPLPIFPIWAAGRALLRRILKALK